MGPLNQCGLWLVDDHNEGKVNELKSNWEIEWEAYQMLM